MYFNIIEQDAKAEGREEGLKEGREEGREKGREEGFIEALLSLVKDNLLSITEAAKRAKISEAEIEKLLNSAK